MRVLIRPASRGELPVLRSMLAEQGVYHQDFEARLRHLLVAQNNGRVIGCVGLETVDEIGIIRALVVASEFRGEDIDAQLLENILDYARLNDLKHVYTFVSSGAASLEEIGFKAVPREEVDPRLMSLPNIDEIYPESAQCLVKQIRPLTDLS